MTEITTPCQHDVIRHLYNEVAVTEKENFRIERLLHSDLSEEYEALEEVKSALDVLLTEPQDRTIEKILAYSRQSRHF